jgi:ribosomal protein S18 acetylase RimI-like enzyme
MISSDMPEKTEILSLASKTGVFKDREITVLEELVDEMLSGKLATYRMLSWYEGVKIAAFAIFGKTPLTDSTWDVYWLIVSPEYQARGLGTRIMEETEKTITNFTPEAVVRVETSTRDEYLGARKFYKGRG